MLFCSQPNSNFIKYCRVLDWQEFNVNDEEFKDVAIVVIDANIGYSVFRDGRTLQQIEWCQHLEDAIETAVERVRYEHAINEMQHEKGEE